jgi:hypothetical protein
MKYDGVHLRQEIDYARETLRDRRDTLKRISDSRAGRTVLRKDGSAGALIENFYHEYTSMLVPRMVSGDPRVRVTTPRGNETAMTAALAGQAYVNEWAKRSRHRVLAQKFATDFALGWGIGIMHLDRRSGFDDDDDDPTAWPVLTRLNQGDAWFDPAGGSWESKRYSGYDYATLKDDLIERADTEDGWDMRRVMLMPEDVDLDVVSRDEKAPRRGEVIVREMWVPGFRLPNAPKWTNGTIFTIGMCSDGKDGFLRKPMPYFGPPWGPLYLYDAYYVPNQPLGMSPLEAVESMVEELNLHAERLSISTARRKRIGIGDKMFEQEVDSIRNCPDGGVVLLSQFLKEKFAEVELGGATPEQRTAILEIRERLGRSAHMNDIAMGSVGGGGLATEMVQAAEATGIATGFLSQRFSDCDEQALRGVLWYVTHARSLRAFVDPKELGAPEELQGKVEVEIRGGPNDGLTFDDYTLTLERYSMERVSEGLMQKRAMELSNMMLMIGQSAPMIAPFVDLRMMLDKLGEAFNMSDYGQMISPEAAAAVAQAQAFANAKPTEAHYAPPSQSMIPGRSSGQASRSAQAKPAQGKQKMIGAGAK